MFARKDVDDVIKKLDKQIFVSEAHLQLAFALGIDTKKFEVYPEFPAMVKFPKKDTDKFEEKQSEFDLLIRETDTGENTLIEFKYKTANHPKNSSKQVDFEISAGVELPLKNQGAIDNGWYDSWRDIWRIEQCVSGKASIPGGKIEIKNGFFILITNCKNYWEEKEGNSKRQVDDLYMNDGEHKAGTKGFTKKHPYRGSRNKSIVIKGNYTFKYQKYHKVEGEEFGDFKILVVEIPGNSD